VPSRFRARLGQRFVVTIAPADGCLVFYPLDAWESFSRRLDEAAVKDKRYRRFVRYVSQYTDEISLDGQGRFLIPPALRAFAGIERDVISIGANTRVEIWAPERFAKTVPTEEEAEAIVTELGLF
jgi:MraZ protein